MTEAAKVRLVVLIPALLLGAFIFSFFHRVWADYWLSRDAEQTTAVITGERSHGVVDYRYSAGAREYTGRSQRNWAEEKSRNLTVGQQSTAFYSSSRPWLSSLEPPAFPPSGTMVMVVALGMELLFVTTLVKPKGRWALNIRT